MNSTPRLSVIRIVCAVSVLGAVFFAGTRVATTVIRTDSSSSTGEHWFAPYVDVTLKPYTDFQDPTVNPNLDAVLAFVVSKTDEPCTPSWGGQYSLDDAATTLDIDRRIARLRQRGGDVIVSFGGAINDELANSCQDVAALSAAYSAVIDRYDLTMIDLDLEHAALDDAPAVARRADAVAQLQKAAAAKQKKLGVWLTVPMAPHGLPDSAQEAIRRMLAAGVELDGVNVLAMDYAESRDPGVDFVTASLAGVDTSAQQLARIYSDAGIHLTDTDALSRIGVTPMIGQNDVPDDRLDLAGARRLLTGALDRGVRRFSMWSMNRDKQCPDNVDSAVANNSCSGVEQHPGEFASIFHGTVHAAPRKDAWKLTVVGSRSSDSTQTAAGPYEQWRPRRDYDQGSKVVWENDVYVAKWWNMGQQPNAPVEHEWDSPWRLVGPVLSSDATLPPPTTMPDGVYPAWNPDAAYLPGDRVELYGRAFRAKWWTRGDDPTADYDNTWETPWEPVGLPGA
jgi:chitinase